MFKTLRFWATIQRGNLGATYTVHLSLIWKHVVDFVLIELFSLGVAAEALRANIDWKRGQFGPQFQVETAWPRVICTSQAQEDHPSKGRSGSRRPCSSTKSYQWRHTSPKCHWRATTTCVGCVRYAVPSRRSRSHDTAGACTCHVEARLL